MPAAVPSTNIDDALSYVETTPQLGQAKQGWDAMKAMLLGGAPYAEPLVQEVESGTLALYGPNVRVDTEAGTPTDDLERIDLTSIAQGREFRLSIATATRSIRIRHKINGGTGAGEFVLPGDTDVTLTDVAIWATFRRVGDQIVMEKPLGADGTPGALPPLTQDVDMRGYSPIGGKPKRVPISATTYTVGLGDRGKNLYFTNASGCAVTLPASAAVWADGDEIFWEQQGGPLTFAVAGGGKPAHALEHDRGLGAPSRGVVWLKSTSPWAWCLQGQTTALEAGAVIERTWLRQEVATSVLTDAGSTAWKNACQLLHTPGDNERWLYIANGRWQSGGGQAVNGAQCRLQLGGAGPQIGPARYSTQYDSIPFVIGKAYGAGPAAQTINLDIQSANATYTAQAAQPEIQALRLEADEWMDLVTTVTAPTNTNIDVVTSTHTLEADDYVALAFTEWRSSDVQGSLIELQIDGVTRHAKDMQRNAAYTGYYLAVIPFTATAASHSLVLKGRSRTSGQNTVFNHAGIALLKKSRFEEMFWVYNDIESNDTTATAFADRVTLAPTLQAGWHYWVLANAATYVGGEGSATGALVRLTNNDTVQGPDARQHSRIINYHAPVDFLASKIVQKTATGAESLAIEYASQRVDDIIRVKSTAIVVLALKRSA